MKIIAIVFLLLNVFLVSCKDSVEVSTSTRIAGVKAKIDSIQDGEISDSVVVVKSDTETGFAQKFGNDIPKDCGPSEQLASLNDRSFFDAIPILHISESLIQQILTSKGNKKFICGIAKNNYMGKEPLLDCSIYTDSLKLSYHTNKDNVGFKGGNLTYLQMIGGDIALFKGHIKIGTSWKEFLNATGIDADYQEAKYRCVISGGTTNWFYFTKGFLREITRIDTVKIERDDIEAYFTQSFGHNITREPKPTDYLIPYDSDIFYDTTNTESSTRSPLGKLFSDASVLDVSESLIRRVLASKGNKKFRCDIMDTDWNSHSEEPLLDCSIHTDSLKLFYYTNKDSIGFKGGNLTYLQMIGGDIALFKGHIKIGTTWEEFLKIVGMDIEYQESKYRCIDIGGGSERWFYFVNGILREITYMSTI